MSKNPLLIPKVGIIVLNWNGKKDTIVCLHSLEKVTYSNVEIVIVDNGSTDDSVAHFKTHFPHMTLIETGENLGYAGGNNVGIEYGLKKGFDFFLILNNDTTVDPGFIEPFLDSFEKDPKIGIQGAKIYLMDKPTQFDHFGGIWKSKIINFDFIGSRAFDDGISWETPLELDYVCGACIIIKREVVDSIGLFEPLFFLSWEEADYCFMARRAGFKVTTCPQSKIWHKSSASFSGKSLSSYFYYRNRLFFIERNFKGLERFYYFLKLKYGDRLYFSKLKFLRNFQLIINKILRLKKDTQKHQERIKRYNVCLLALRDYKKRNLGIGNAAKLK